MSLSTFDTPASRPAPGSSEWALSNLFIHTHSLFPSVTLIPPSVCVFCSPFVARLVIPQPVLTDLESLSALYDRFHSICPSHLLPHLSSVVPPLLDTCTHFGRLTLHTYSTCRWCQFGSVEASLSLSPLFAVLGTLRPRKRKKRKKGGWGWQGQ